MKEEPIIVKIELKKIKWTGLKKPLKRTIKKGRSKFLNVYLKQKVRNKEKKLDFSIESDGNDRFACSGDLSQTNSGLSKHMSKMLCLVQNREKKAVTDIVNEYEPEPDTSSGGKIEKPRKSDETHVVDEFESEPYSNLGEKNEKPRKSVENDVVNEYEPKPDWNLGENNEKPRKGVGNYVANDYEPTLDMFKLYELGSAPSKCVEEMSLHLYLLRENQKHCFKLKEIYEKALSDDHRNLIEHDFKKAKNYFLKETKEKGKRFIKSFEKVYDFYGRTNCLMLIFVEVIKSLLKRAKSSMKRPNSKRIQLWRDLMHGMFRKNKCNKYDHFFLHLKEFEEIFIKAYSSSFAKNFESPSYQPLLASPSIEKNEKKYIYIDISD